jgi:hypothetical protein
MIITKNRDEIKALSLAAANSHTEFCEWQQSGEARYTTCKCGLMLFIDNCDHIQGCALTRVCPRRLPKNKVIYKEKWL